MTAFARAAAALHRDANLSVECSWAPGWDRAWPRTLRMDIEAETATLDMELSDMRGVETKRTAETFAAGTMGGLSQSVDIDLADADLPAPPQRGDVIVIGDVGYEVETAALDVEGVSWRLTLAEVDIVYAVAEVAPPQPPSEPTPIAIEDAALGDSYVFLAGNGRHDFRGPWHWASAFLGGAFRMDLAAMSGIVGETMAEIHARVSDITEFSPRPSYCFLASPFNNDIAEGVPQATSIDAFRATLSALNAQGITVVAGPTFPRDTSTGAQLAQTQSLNAQAAALASPSSLIWVDWASGIIDPGTGYAYANMLYDGIHIGTRAAHLMGQAIATAMAPLIDGEAAMAIPGEPGNWLSNGVMSGEAAVSTGGWTGSSAPGWTATHISAVPSAGTYVMAKAARPDGYGDWVQIALTGLTHTTFWYGGIVQVVDVDVAELVAGDWCEVIAEFEIEAGAENLAGPFMQVLESDGSTVLQYNFIAFQYGGAAQIPTWPTRTRLVVRSPPFQIRPPAGDATVSVRLGFAGEAGEVGGITCVGYVGRAAGRKIDR